MSAAVTLLPMGPASQQTVSASGSYQYQHEQISIPSVAGFSTSIAGPVGNAVVTVNQPIFTGGLATSKLNAAQADILAGREGLRHTEITVIQSVVGAYLDAYGRVIHI